MFRQLTLAICLVIFLSLGVLFVTAAAANDDELDGYVPDEVLVKLVQAADLPGVATDHHLDPIPLDQFGARPIYRLRILDGATPPDRAAALAADARVMVAEPNFVGETPEGRQRTPWAGGGNSDEYAEQWAPVTIRLPEAHTVTSGDGITVAVLDTGIDATHPALDGRLVSGYDFVDMDADPSEVGMIGQDLVFGHGTHVAGIMALASPEASIMPVRVLDRDGVGNVWVLVEALAFAVDPDGNPATDDGVDVINMSLGTTRRTDLLTEIITDITCANGVDDDDDDDGDDDGDDDDNGCSAAGGRGVVVVAAAGNRGASVREYPAAEETPGVLAVAASTITDTLASFSTFGPWVPVAAPGQDILSTVPGGGFGTWSGTSMAAPFAAGQAALLRAAYPDLAAAEVVERIVTTAAPIGGLVPLRIDTAASLGVVDTIPPPSDCGAPITLLAVADSWIDQNSAANNFGTDAILKVRSQGPGDNFRTLIRFALPASLPESCVVESAVLRLYAAAWTSGRTLQALRVATTWSETSVAWNNQPATTGEAATATSGSNYREWNVTTQVQAIFDTGANNGFLIRDAAEGGNGFEQQFHGREKGESPPLLAISFAPAGG